MNTTFTCASSIVYAPARTVEGLRSPTREDWVGDCRISNRSNYTRVTFFGANDAAFLIPVGPYSVRVLSKPGNGMTSFNLIGANGERSGVAVSPNELRAIAYGLLAAANWVDTRDTAGKQANRQPQRPTEIFV